MSSLKKSDKKAFLDFAAWSFNITTSVGIIMVNKALMATHGFSFATTLTGLHFVTTTMMTIVFRWLGLSQPSHLPLPYLIKFVIFSNLSIVGMNVSLMWNSVGFYQIAKLCMIPASCLLEVVFDHVHYSRHTKLSIMVVLIGVAVCTVTDVSVNAKGLVAAVIAVWSTALQQYARKTFLQQYNELAEMRQRLQSHADFIGDLKMRTKELSAHVEDQRGQLCVKIRMLSVASKTLGTAHSKLQEADKLLSGENGHGRVKNLERILRTRQQYMTTQVAQIYPVRPLNDQSPVDKPGLIASIIRTGDAESMSPNGSQSGQTALAILGLQLSKLSIKKTSYFSDKTEIQKSATVLGYIAHAASLIASYLDVPLRYPLRLGGSCSYVLDHAPSVEPSSIASGISSTPLSTSTRTMEFPLFFEGQETTRSAYAIFLLNKDIEQLLNHIGAESLGPRHVLANLKQLTTIIQSQQYISH